MSRFFISYTASDQPWAEWVAWQLENAGHSTILQAWDFLPGSNFVLEMQKALESSSTTILILSRDYINKAFPTAEWAASFVKDPTGENRKLIPIRVSDVNPPGLLSSIVYVDLFCAESEENAMTRLLASIEPVRRKPIVGPIFPKYIQKQKKPLFPMECKPSNSATDKLEIEIRINQRFEDFSGQEQEKIVRAIHELLSLNYDLKVSNIVRGSVLLTVELQKRDALKLFILHHIGKLREYGVINITIKGFPLYSIDDAIMASLAMEPAPQVAGNRESGTIIFLDYVERYGILKRDAGGFIKFQIPREFGSLKVGKQISVYQQNNKENYSPLDGLDPLTRSSPS